MADIVGSAFVRVKLLTDKLSKDIEKSVKKGLDDADLEKIGSDGGDDLGEGVSDGFDDSINKNVKKNAQNFIDKLRIELKKNADSTGRSVGDDLLDGLGDSIDKGLNTDAKNFLDRLRIELKKKGKDTGRETGDSILDELEDVLSPSNIFIPALPDFDPFPEFPGRRPDFSDPDPVVFPDFLPELDKIKKEISEGSGFSRALEKLDSRLKKLGGGSKLGFFKQTILVVGAAITAALPYIQDVGSAVLAYATGLVAQIGFLGTALTGIGAAAGTAIGSFALAFIPIALAFKSETSFLEKFIDKADEVGQVFLRIGSATQLTLLPSLSIALDIIKGIVPLFSEFGIKIGKVVGNFAIFAAATLTSEDAQYRLRKIMASALRIFEMLIPIVLNVGDILSGIWLAASPAAELFVEKIGELVENWKVLTRVGLLSGTLESTLTKWYERAELLFGALGNLSGALFDILDIGADSSDNVFYQFDRWAERYRKWTESEEGKNKIALIFENSLSVMRELNGIAADLFDGIFGRLGNIGGVDSMVESLENFRDIIPDIQKVWAEMYTQIKSISSGIFDKLKYAAEQLKDPLGRLGTQLLEFFRIMEETGAFEIFIRLLVLLTDTMAVFLAIPGLAQAAGYILAFSAAGKLATIGLKPFVKILGPVVSGLKSFTTAYAGASVTQLSMFPNLAGSTKGLGGFAGGLKSVVAAAKDAGKASLVASAAGGVGKIGSVAKASSAGVGALAKGVIGVGSSLLSVPGPTMIAGAALLAVGGAFAFSKYQSQKAAQEIRKNTEYFGTLHGGVEITTESIKRYNRETNTLSKGTLKLIEQVGLWDVLAGSADDATKSLEKFAEIELDAGNLDIIRSGLTRATYITDQFKGLADPFEAVKEEFNLNKQDFLRFLSGERVYINLTDYIEIVGVSAEEVKKVLNDSAKSIKDTIKDWAENEIVNDILSPEQIKIIQDNVLNVNNSDLETVQAFNSGNQQLRDGAILLAKDFEFLGRERIAQIRLQSINTEGLVDEAVATSLMKTEAEKLGAAWVEARKTFTSKEFVEAFPEAVSAATEFSTVIDKIRNTELSGGPGKLLAKGLIDEVSLGEVVNKLGSVEEKMFVLDHFAPELETAFGNMYRTMKDLPDEAFNAQALNLNLDAGKLRDVFNQVTVAIDELQQAALSKLPSIGQLLEDATTVKEDGSEVFDQKKFTKSLEQTTLDTLNFTKNLDKISKTGNKELLRLALESGPTAAAQIANGVGGVANKVLTEALAASEYSKAALATWVEKEFGGELAEAYSIQAGVIGGDFNQSLYGSLTSPVARLGMKNAGISLVDAFADEFMRTTITPVIDKDGTVRWGVKKGRPSTNQKPGLGLPEYGSNSPNATIFSSTGGFVPGGGGFRSGGRGTDTVPAWLTPGEFILRKSVSSAIPKDILIALNNGDSHLLGLLQSPNANKSGIFSSGTSFRRVGEGGTSEGASTAAGRRAPAAQGNVIIQQMNIESPTPLESARLVADRLKILQSQLTRR